MATNCIIDIKSEDCPTPNLLTWRDLHTARFAFDSPFQLHLSDEEVLFAECVVRLIPKRRMVVFGIWKGKSVVAKLFFDAQHGKRHMEKDLAGIRSLQKNEIPTPPVFYQGTSLDKRIHILLFERIFNVKNLEEIWRSKENIEELLPLLHLVMVELATQHVLGVLQHDLHLKNFLVSKKIIYTLDGAEIEIFPHLLSKKTSLHNLSLFFSQLGVSAEAYQERLFLHYAASRGWIVKPEEMQDLSTSVKKWNERRWKKFEKKIFRQCTSFARIENLHTFVMFDRSYGGAEFLAFIKNPDQVFDHPTAEILKAGRSATVIKVMLDHHVLVVKRYNIKNIWHRLRRCLRPTRAENCWCLAQKLDLFGVLTARPVAFLEKKYLGLRGKSYYVTEYVAGEDTCQFFTKHRGDEEKIFTMITRITALLKNMVKLDVTHGDLKSSNILIDEHQQPVLIDLDGAVKHDYPIKCQKSWRKEIKRFLRNFQDMPSIQEKFKQALL